jgi:hypothetical protein
MTTAGNVGTGTQDPNLYPIFFNAATHSISVYSAVVACLS